MTAFDSQIYDRYGLLNLPRKFGFPVQISVNSISHLKTLINNNDGKLPLYISVNSNNGHYVNLSQVYFDLDGHGLYSMEDALKDERTLAEYFESEKVDFLIDMTGRGFRLLVKLIPDIMTISDASQILKGYTKHIKESLKLKTVDLKVAEPMRIMRPPLTTYVYQDNDKNYVQTKRHVLPLDMDILFNSDLAELTYMSENLQFRVMDVQYRRMNINEIEEYREKIDYATTNNINGTDIDFYSMTDDELKNIMKEIFRDVSNMGTDMGPDMNLINRLLTTHPNHSDRFISAVKLKESIFSPSYSSALAFFDRLSSMAKWDNRNLDIQAKQIRSIYDGGYGVKK